jgi:4,4'-diaponeurosporenoate glycosyltransferase
VTLVPLTASITAGSAAAATGAWWGLPPWSVSSAIYLVGHLAGWLLLARVRRLPAVSEERPAVAVVVPARDEARSLPTLLPRLVAQLRPGDELVVVDDSSSDATAEVAAALGARVVAAPEPPPGWAGKPHACTVGVQATDAEVLVFLDADLTPAPDLLDRLAAEVARRPDAAVSVQPWHDMVRPIERLSLVPNLVVVMGTGAFGPLGVDAAGPVAFGPVFACRRDAYERSGGHAHVTVRHAVVEDLALARLFPASSPFLGARDDTTFRMYPDGGRAVWRGWAKNLAAGASRTRWWAVAGTAAWVTALAGGWVTSAWWYAASAVQVAVLGRRVGRCGPVTAIAHPALVGFFALVFLRSALASALGWKVTWKGRPAGSR